jgi:hypothetical protein
VKQISQEILTEITGAALWGQESGKKEGSVWKSHTQSPARCSRQAQDAGPCCHPASLIVPIIRLRGVKNVEETVGGGGKSLGGSGCFGNSRFKSLITDLLYSRQYGHTIPCGCSPEQRNPGRLRTQMWSVNLGGNQRKSPFTALILSWEDLCPRGLSNIGHHNLVTHLDKREPQNL